VLYDQAMAQLLLPVDRTDWVVPPTSLSPYYNPKFNKVVFPAAYLQPPVFDFQMPTAFLYGSIGYVMGHELTHAFDWSGSKTDHLGTTVPQWFSGTAATAFNDSAKCFQTQYNGVRAYPSSNSSSSGFQVDGELTLSENIADAGGVALAHLAYRTRYSSIADDPSYLPGHSNTQLMLLGVGQGLTHCALSSTQWVKNQVETDTHAPGAIRGTVPLMNFPAFASEFNCPKGSAMNPEQRCMLWTTNMSNQSFTSGFSWSGSASGAAGTTSSDTRGVNSNIANLLLAHIFVMVLHVSFKV